VIASKYVTVDGGLQLHYREVGSGPPVLMLHGWPTSSYLWRNILPEVGKHRRAIALDLPGFGRSDKPLDASYSFRYHERVLDGFLAALGIDTLGLVVHDLGGPIGLWWAVHHADRIDKLGLLNTIVYPPFSAAVMAFVGACRVPGLSHLISSQWGLKVAMQIGVGDRSRLSDEAVRAVQEPFESRAARRALCKAGYGLHPRGFNEIVERLPSLRMPIRAIYGQKDRILPEVGPTMERIARELPQTELTVLPDCGHFCQEERPEEIGQMLDSFFRDG
jgi:pimeloyl-ACP methyl ester carboxylesterase